MFRNVLHSLLKIFSTHVFFHLFLVEGEIDVWIKEAKKQSQRGAEGIGVTEGISSSPSASSFSVRSKKTKSVSSEAKAMVASLFKN